MAARTTRLLGTAVLVAGGLAVGLLLCEGIARVRQRMHCVEQIGGFNVRDRRFGWGNRPGARGWTQRCLRERFEWRSWVRIGRQGLRGPDVEPKRADGFRVLVLGDSFTHGAQVAEEELVTTLLERRLAVTTAGRRVELLNAGVQGWGTDNALLWYEAVGQRLAPELVVLVFNTLNDVFENSRRLVAMSDFWADKPYFALRDGRLVREHWPLPVESRRAAAVRAAADLLVTRTAIGRELAAIERVRTALLIPAPPRPVDGVPGVAAQEVYLRRYPPHWAEAWRITRGLLLMMRRAVEASGGRFAVVVVNAREEISDWHGRRMLDVVPALRELGVDLDKPNRLAVGFLARRGIPVIPTLAAFRAAFRANGTPGFFPRDVHWAPAGHALAARVIADELVALGLVPAAQRVVRATESATP